MNLSPAEALLGSMIVSRDAIDMALAKGVAAEHFERDSYKRIFTAIVAAGPDPVLVAAELGDAGCAAIGGKVSLIELASNGHLSHHAGRYADEVLELAQRRAVRDAASQLLADISDAQDPDITIARAMSALEAAATPPSSSVNVAEALPDVIEARRAPAADVLHDTEFGLRFRRGNYVVIGAHTSVGKSAIAVQLARQFARRGHRSVLYSYEMSAAELIERMATTSTGISMAAMDSGLGERVGPVIESTLAGGWAENVDIVEAASMTLDQLVADVHKRARAGLDLVVVDYLQIAVDGSETSEVTRASRKLKLLAAETGIPVLALSQLRRQSHEQAAGARPHISDIRQSGAIAQDADTVILLWRPDEERAAKVRDRFRSYLIGDPAYTGMTLCTFDCVKARNGRTGERPVFFDPDRLTWHAVDEVIA